MTFQLMCYLFKLQIEHVWKSKYPKVLASAVPKDFPFTPFLRDSILTLVESGQLDMLKSRWVTPVHDCSMPGATAKEITVTKVVTLFLLVGIGGLLSLALFIGELLLPPEEKEEKKDEGDFSDDIVMLNKLQEKLLKTNEDYASSPDMISIIGHIEGLCQRLEILEIHQSTIELKQQ